MPYDQEVIDGVKEILKLVSPDRRINNLLNERKKGKPQRNHLLLNDLADILEEEFLTINKMEQSIVASLTGLGIDGEIHIGGGEDDRSKVYVISNPKVTLKTQQLQPIQDIVDALREDAKRCQAYDKTRTP